MNRLRFSDIPTHIQERHNIGAEIVATHDLNGAANTFTYRFFDKEGEKREALHDEFFVHPMSFEQLPFFRQ